MTQHVFLSSLCRCLTSSDSFYLHTPASELLHPFYTYLTPASLLFPPAGGGKKKSIYTFSAYSDLCVCVCVSVRVFFAARCREYVERIKKKRKKMLFISAAFQLMPFTKLGRNSADKPEASQSKVAGSSVCVCDSARLIHTHTRP